MEVLVDNPTSLRLGFKATVTLTPLPPTLFSQSLGELPTAVLVCFTVFMHFSLELPKIPLPTFLVLSFVLCTALFEYIRIILSAIAFDYIKQVSSCSVSIIPPLLCSIRSTATPSSLSVTGENLARHSRSNQNTSGKLTFSTERILLRRHRSCEKSDL